MSVSKRGWLQALRPLWAGLPAAWLLASLLPSPRASYPIYVLGLACLNGVLVLSLNIVNGFAGQFSLGQAGFMALGGYTCAWLTLNLGPGYTLAGIPEALSQPLFFLFALLSGGLVAGLAGAAVGFPSLRLKGDYLAIVTLGFGEIIRVFIENTKALGGAIGLSGLPPLSGLGWIFSALLITAVCASRLRASVAGRAMVAVREDELAASAMGIDATRAKVTAFVLSAFFAGVAGGLLGHYLQILSPKDFTFVKSIEIVAMVVLGGLGSIPGVLAAALILTTLPELLRPLQDFTGTDFRMVIYSGLLIAMMLLRPQGLLGDKSMRDWLRRRRGAS